MASIAQDKEFLDLLPSKWWVNFFKKFDQIEDLPLDEWKTHHLLAHFSKRYQNHFGKRFSFTIKGRPSSCKEVYQINHLMAVLGTSNQETVKNYIDWMFDTKIIPTKRKLRSIGFLSTADFCNEFKLIVQAKKKIDRTTELPPDYKQIVDDLDLPVNTFGDLAFAKQALDVNSDGKKVYEQMFNKLYAVGFNIQMLQNLR